MNSKIKLFFSCSCLFFISMAQDKEIKTLTTSPFTGIKVFSEIKLTLIHSDVNKAIVSGPQSDDVILSMRNGILQIKIALGSYSDSIPTKIDLYHSKLLNKISALQGAQVISREPIRQTSLNLESKTGGEIDIEVYADRLDAVANTGGRLALKGVVSNLNLKVNIGGSCEAEDLQTSQTQVKLLGGGYAYLLATKLLEAKVVGGSVLRVFGKPEKVVYERKLSGKIFFEE